MCLSLQGCSACNALECGCYDASQVLSTNAICVRSSRNIVNVGSAGTRCTRKQLAIWLFDVWASSKLAHCLIVFPRNPELTIRAPDRMKRLFSRFRGRQRGLRGSTSSSSLSPSADSYIEQGRGTRTPLGVSSPHASRCTPESGHEPRKTPSTLGEGVDGVSRAEGSASGVFLSSVLRMRFSAPGACPVGQNVRIRSVPKVNWLTRVLAKESKGKRPRPLAGPLYQSQRHSGRTVMFSCGFQFRPKVSW